MTAVTGRVTHVTAPSTPTPSPASLSACGLFVQHVCACVCLVEESGSRGGHEAMVVVVVTATTYHLPHLTPPPPPLVCLSMCLVEEVSA